MDRADDTATHRSFDPIDFAVFAGMLGISTVIGVYQAYKSRKTTDAVGEYLLGGQKMSIFPISMSLIASYISGIAILGLPAEMYVYGTQYWSILFADLCVPVTMAVVYLPVFYGLGITSSYEYLNLRFNNAVRLTGSVIFLIKMVNKKASSRTNNASNTHMCVSRFPATLYTAGDIRPRAGVQSSDRNEPPRDGPVGLCRLHILHYFGERNAKKRRSSEPLYTRDIPLALGVRAPDDTRCILQGGLKAVVWTDAIQTIVMFGGVMVVATLGTMRIGGIERVWERNRDTGRIEFFNMNPDPTARHTFWTVAVGGYLNWLANCSVNQSMVQRCLSMPNLKKANATIVIMTIGIIIIVSLSCYTGLVIFAAFYDCDPVTTKRIRKPDQLLPYFVMEMTGSIPGLPGLFVAGVFSAALSTMSTGLNSMSGVIYGDMIKPWFRNPVSEVTASRTMQGIVVVIGAICVGLVFLVEKLTGLIQACRSLSGITAGPLLGMFTLGMFFPFANSAGALVGGLVSLNLVAWISFGTQAAISTGDINYSVKPISIDGCPDALKNRVNNLTLIAENATSEQLFFLYRMSYLWYTWVGFLTAIILGVLVSWITGGNVPKSGDEKLYTPMVRGFLRSKLSATNRQDSMQLAKIETTASNGSELVASRAGRKGREK
ncbi:sodium-coupled monocarboxylate transporter 1-like isoform X1 [Colletes gigas]|uniref:sodium-coupled monocarboxylate transporter 1-like isoform X1 n=1 Tax=Colletes gigas TaxID=935657 RepID=UPI001C9B86F5|nr:sodium-coupled monocarboxylate transporter 1-like isoform X1 [Colletes gigas]